MSEVDIEVSCPVCQEDYSDERSPLVLDCGHSLCNRCTDQLLQQSANIACPTCRHQSTKKPSKNYILEDAISIIKKLQEKPKVVVPPNSVQCTTCPKIENESEMWVCRNCTKEAYQFDVVMEHSAQIDLEVKSVALCGCCAIRFHVNNDHETVPFFPIFSGLHFRTHLESVKLLQDDFNEQAKLLHRNYTNFGNAIQTSNIEVEKMTDMMRKSKSSDVQQQFMDSIGQEIKRMSETVLKVANFIDEEETAFSQKFFELSEKNRKDEEEKCREGIERKSETPCAECATVTVVEKMFCCVKCSEHAAELMLETIAVEAIEKFTVSDFALCANCVISSHTGGGQHEIVKIQDLQSKYTAVIRLLVLSMKSKKMEKRFAELLGTFGFYTQLMQGYEKNISRMSKIIFETRGHPTHQQVVDELEKSIAEAERAMTTLRTTSELNILEGASSA